MYECCIHCADSKPTCHYIEFDPSTQECRFGVIDRAVTAVNLTAEPLTQVNTLMTEEQLNRLPSVAVAPPYVNYTEAKDLCQVNWNTEY